MLIAVAGPYSAKTTDARQRNLDAIRAALPVVEFLAVSEQDRYEAIMEFSLAVVDK